MKYLLFISFILFTSACNERNNTDHPSGGYEFSKHITDKEFYHYPLIGKISRRDSFDIAYADGYFFRSFKEPNISLQPADTPIFRLAFKGNYYSYIISLTEYAIVVKMNYSGRYWPEVDTDKLTETERWHFNILRKEFPLDEARPYDVPPAPPPPPDQLEEYQQKQKKHDSIMKNTPKLLYPGYYDFLLKKVAVNTRDTFSFSTKTIKINKDEFKRIAGLINRSGYWKMTYKKNYSGVSDPSFYLLEANNGTRYNTVVTEDAFQDEELGNACAALIKMAKINGQAEKFKQ